MAHISVLVIGNDPEAQLAPFELEPAEGSPYLVFMDMEEEWRRQYETEGEERVIMPDGTAVSPWHQVFRIPGTQGVGSDTHQVPASLETRKIPYKELYATFDDFARACHDFEPIERYEGRYGFYKNPYGKWEWYSLGGRWARAFFTHLKDGRNIIDIRSPGIAQVRKSELDIVAIRNIAWLEAEEYWDEVHSRLRSILGAEYENALHSFSSFDNVHKIHKREARHVYGEQALVMAIRKINDEGYGTGEITDLLLSRSMYREKHVAACFCTFAVIENGNWHEREWSLEMTDPRYDEWTRFTNKLLDALPDDTLLSIYDCHV